jgi:hypothetical protein
MTNLPNRSALPFILAAVLIGLLAGFNSLFDDAPQYRVLAESFFQGKLYLVSMPDGWGDTALFQGRHYWPLGPLPAILLMPVVWSGFYHQGLLSFFSVLAVFYLCFRLAERLGYPRSDSCWLAVAFCFGTSFIGVAVLPLSWSFASVLAVLFLFLAIYEHEGQRRFLIIGTLIGLAMASRPLTGLNALLFAGAIALEIGTTRAKMIRLASFSAPTAMILLILCWYNFARFGTPWEAGYTYQISADGRMLSDLDFRGNIAGPLFSFSNIPVHFRTFAFGLPDRDAVGVSVFLMSPFLVYICLPGRNWDRMDWALVLNICVVLIASLAFRSAGLRQIGYRFSLDYMPFVFWLLMRSRTQLSGGAKALIWMAVVIDVSLVAYFLAVRPI